MLKKDDIIYVKGAIPFKNKKEKKKGWKQIKREFGDDAKIFIHDGIITYTAIMNRNIYF